MLARTISGLAYCAVLFGCFGCTDDGGLAPDAVGGDDGTQDDDAKADGAGGLYDYFAITPGDVGTTSWYVQRINRTSMNCSDGVVRPYCTATNVRIADGLNDRFATDQLGYFDRADRGYSYPPSHSSPYFAPVVVRGEMHGDELLFTEIWAPGRFLQPAGVWVEISDLHAPGTSCADASWATACESRLNSTVEWPISVANLVDRPYELQDLEREQVTNPTGHVIVVGTRGYLDGLPIREMVNIYTRKTSNP